MGRLCTGGSSEIGSNGRVSDDREWYSTIRGRQVVHGGSWLHICGDSLGLTVVFRYSRETGSARGIVAACFWGLLGENGCVLKMLGGRDIMDNDDKGFF